MGLFGRRKKVVAPGDLAPSFKLTGVDGTTRSLEEILARGPALLAFFKISCPVCQLSAPYLERLAANKTLQVIGISQDEGGGTKGFLDRFGAKFPTLLDQGSEGYPTSNAYGISSVPSLFLLDANGTVEHAFNGFSKRDFEHLGHRAGMALFGPDDHVPDWKAG